MILQTILKDCQFVMDNSKYVTINYEVLDSFIKNIDCNNLKHWLSSNPYGILDLNIDFIINFLLVFTSINYSFWGDPKWTIETDDGLKDGSDALLYCLLNYAKNNNSTDFSKLTKKEFISILKGNIKIPLFEERYNTIVNISNIVNNNMNGNFYNSIKNITIDTQLFNLIINNFSCFNDERTYKDKTIHFYKLAQLLTSDILHIRSNIEKIEVDYSHLLGCADYKIPQIMRALGIIEYNDELSLLVDNKQELCVSSLYEVEIRASMIVVINYIADKINCPAMDVNDYFFTSGKNVKTKIKPYHLCRNTNY